MFEIQGAGNQLAQPVRAGCGAADIPAHLSGALRDHFAPADRAVLPEGLAALVVRFEAALASAGQRLDRGFRDDLVAALPVLRTFALSLRADPARADDLVQETLAKAWANRTRFAAGTNFTAWLFTILRNQFYSEIRKAKREVEDADGAHAGRLAAPAGQEHVVALGAVMDLIGALPAAQRQALLLVGAEGFSYEEAAVRLGCQVGTVKSRVSRARAALVGTLDPAAPRGVGAP